MREADKKDNMKINREGARIITLTGLFMALICVATLFFKVPIPLGYAHLGTGFIFLAAVFLKNPYAMTATGVGSALADLLGGYAVGILLDKDSMAVHGDASAGDHGFSVGNR